jgi:hypothetical protein
MRIRQAENHRFYQSLFDCSRHLGFREDVRGSFRQMAGSFV